MRRFSLAALFAATFLASPSAFAQTADDCYQATLKNDDLEVIRVCTRALEKGGMNDYDRSVTVSNRGLGYLRNKEYDKAIIDLSDALLINPKNPYAFNSRGDAWLQKNNFDRAFADFDEALRINADFTGAIYNRGVAFEKQGNTNAARDEYRKAVATKGDSALDKWARDRARERLTALGDNQQQQQQQQRRNDNTQGERDSEQRRTDRRELERRDDRRDTNNQRNDNPPSNTGRGNDGSYIRRK